MNAPPPIYCTTMCSWMVFIEIVNSSITFDNVLMLHLLLHMHKCSKGWVSFFVEAYFSSFMMFDLSLGPAVGIRVHHHKSTGLTTAFSRPDLTTIRPPLILLIQQRVETPLLYIYAPWTKAKLLLFWALDVCKIIKEFKKIWKVLKVNLKIKLWIFHHKHYIIKLHWLKLIRRNWKYLTAAQISVISLWNRFRNGKTGGPAVTTCWSDVC